MLSRRPWRLLLGLWGTYWAALAAFVLGPLAVAVYTAVTAGPDQGTVSVNVGTDGLTATVVRSGQTIHTLSLHVVSAALWIAGPPLLAWLALAIRERRVARREPQRDAMSV
jgi:hypothetical protein